ncbi:MAG: hypothetical protein M1838_004163 [Thelocarpon superellum]|nr:MAG: hypothetical protein M1838_004163 [Thelocarpon superellum]
MPAPIPNKNKGKKKNMNTTTHTNTKQKTSKPRKKKAVHAGHLDTFFAGYPEFNYRRGQSSTREFYRMCDFFGWDRDDPERGEAHDDFKTALVQQFNSLYGTDEESIESWRGLCLALDVDPLPDNVKDAKEIFKGMFVNLVDLVDTANTGDEVTQFGSLEELKEYTINTGKYFPKESAYAGGMLKHLLREIVNKYHNGVSGRRRR